MRARGIVQEVSDTVSWMNKKEVRKDADEEMVV